MLPRPPSRLSPRLSPRVLALGVMTGAAILLVVLGAHTHPKGYPSVHRTPTVGPTTQQVVVSSPGPTPTPSPSPTGDKASGPAWVGIAVYLVIGVLLVTVVVVILRTLGRPERRRRGRREGGRPGGAGDQARQDLAQRLVDAAGSGLDALELGPVEDAIIACWLRLQDAALSAGVPPDPADTPEDFVTRVLRESAARPEPLAAMADLYREARFSTHRLDEADRAAARLALEAISSDLAAGARG